MIEITKCIEWEMGHRIPNHGGKCRNLHGHRYRLELTVSGELNATAGDSSEGMIIDFADIKRLMTQRIYDVVDHGFMAHDKDELLTAMAAIPLCAGLRLLRVPFVPTVENVSIWCYQQLADGIPGTVRIVRLRLYETPDSWADFQP